MTKYCNCEARKKAVKQGKIYFQYFPVEWRIELSEGYYTHINIIERCPYCRELLPNEYDLEVYSIKADYT